MSDKQKQNQGKKPEQAIEIKDLKKGKDTQVETQSSKIKGGGVKDHSV